MLKLLQNFKCFLFFIILFLEGCSQGKTEKKEELVVAIPSAPVLLDPRLAIDAEGQKIAALLHDGLIRLNEKGEPVPALASTWRNTAPLVYQFDLRRDLFFSTGEPFTSRDVACTYHYIQDEKNRSPLRGEFEMIRLKAIDDYSVEITLKEPYAPFFVMLQKGIVGCDGKSGTGPYLLVSHEEGIKVLLEVNPKYFGEPPRLKRLVFEVVKDDTTRVLKLIKGEVDLVQNAIPALLIEKVLETGKIGLMQNTGTTFAYMGFNLKDPVLKNKKVRQAIAYAIDRGAVIEHLWKGRARSANSLLTPGHWAYNEDLPAYDHQVEKAKQLLDEAGFKDPDGKGPQPRLRLSFKTSTNKERIEIAKLLAHQLQAVGIAAKVEPYEWGTFFRDVKRGNFQIYSLTWVGVADPDIYYNILHSSQFPPNGSNRNFYVNPKADQLTLQGRQTLDMEQRRGIYHEIQKMANEDLPFIPLWHENNVVLYWKDLKGLKLTPNPDYRNFMGIYR